LIIGQVLSFLGNPIVEGPGAAQVRSDGAVLIRNGLIAEVGDAETLKSAHPDAPVTHMGDHLIMPGFVDAHVHYPQTAIIASWGKRLIDWLNTYTFPEEMRFGDAEYASQIADRYLDLALSYGTTTMASYCTIHPESVTGFFEAAARRNMRVLAGKTCMDRNAPDGLMDTAQSAYDQSKALLETWHDVGRASYVITPRFSPTSTRVQLDALGALWAEHPDCLMQTHISEQTDEVAWVKELFPEAEDYLATYEAAGLLGANAVFGHAIHLTDRETARIKETGAALVHCPTSNMFIGSGLFETTRHCKAGQRVGLASDTGGGSSFSMLRTMAAAYEVGQLGGHAIHPAGLLWLATGGSADALGQSTRIGQLKPGLEADVIAIDLKSTPAIMQRAERGDDIWDAVFPTIMMGDDRAISAVWVAGKRQIARQRP
jgi:guanine deaminase